MCNFIIIFQGQGGKITDMISFYTLPSTIMHNPSYKTLKAAYSFYNVGTSTPWYDLMQDALVLAKQVISFILFHLLFGLLVVALDKRKPNQKATVKF